MGIPASVWFVIAVAALLLGVLLLLIHHLRDPDRSSDRRRWAATKGWEFLGHDPVLPGRWRYGSIHQGGPGVAHDLVSGWLPTSSGSRRVYIFDHEQAGALTSVLVVVQSVAMLPLALELRSPLAPLPDDGGLDLLEPVGQRYAFVSDPADAGRYITPRLARAGDAIDEDVELVWAEDTWVLATAPVGSSPERIEGLLTSLVEVAAALEDVKETAGAPRQTPGSDGAPARGTTGD